MANPMNQKKLAVLPSDIPISIVNGYSTSGTLTLVTATQANLTTKAVLSGTVVAGTLIKVLDISGSGCLDALAVTSVDATSRTHRIRIKIDGTVIFDTTSAAATSADQGVVPVGMLSNNTTTKTLLYDSLRFNMSCVIEYASSVSETDKTNLYYAYKLFR